MSPSDPRHSRRPDASRSSSRVNSDGSRPAPWLERVTVALTLAWLVWLPLPLGSNRDWAIGVLVAWAGLLGLLYGVMLWRQAAGAPGRGTRRAEARPTGDASPHLQLAQDAARPAQSLQSVPSASATDGPSGAAGRETRRAEARPTEPPSSALQPPPQLSAAQQAALPLLACLLAAQAWVAVQWLGGLTLDVGQTFQYLMLGLSYTLVFWLVVSLFATRARLQMLLWTLVLSGAFQAFYGAFMTLSGIEWLFLTPKQFGLGNATGTFVNRNHLAGYLAMTLGLGIGLLLALRDKRPFEWIHVLELLLGPKARLRLALVIMVIGLVMTHSRGGNAAFVGSLLALGAVYGWVEKEHRLRNGLILASLLVIDVLIVSQYFGLERLTQRVLATQVEVTQSAGAVTVDINDLRDEVARDALPLALDRPFIGQGAGSFESVFPQYAGPDIKGHADHAHNDYLEFWIEYGALGLLPLAAFVLLALWQALRPLLRREGAFRSGVGFGAGMALTALLIHSFTDFNLQIPANAATFVVVAAMAVLAGQHSAPRPRHGARHAAHRPHEM